MKPKPKMVKAWVFARGGPFDAPFGLMTHFTKAEATGSRSYWKDNDFIVGPIVRIEVPAPVNARKGKS